MDAKPVYIGIIPARGGSRRLPGKNIALLNKKPLIAYTIEAAQQANSLSRTLVSTDDPEIGDVARLYSAEVPFLRPAAIAADDSSMLAVIEHTLHHLEPSEDLIDAVVLLQPTSPFRTGRHIDEALELFERTGADTVTSVRIAHEHPYYSWTQKCGEESIVPFFTLKEQLLSRQDLPPAFVENGAIYVIRRSLLVQETLYGARVVPYMMDNRCSLDIDTLEDFQYAEFVMNQGGNG